MKIPFVDLAAHHRKFARTFLRDFKAAVSSSDFILGGRVEAFERAFARFVGTRHAVGVSNGTDALRLAFEAIGLGPGDEVIVPANTYVASALGVTWAGGTPRFVDVDPETFTMDPKAVEKALTPRTRALLPVHLFGHPAEMGPLLHLARARGLRVVEDAAQAHGATYQGRRVGGLGDLGCFSFYPSKNLGALGDAGMVVTDDDGLAERLRMLRNMGQRAKYEHCVAGHNNRLDALQAAFLSAKLPRLATHNRMRQAAARRYERALRGSGVEVPSVRAGCTHVYHLYAIQHDRRDEVRRALEAEGIGCGVYYPKPVPFQECYSGLGAREGEFPVAERLSRRSLALPMFPELSARQVEAVARAVRSAL